MITRSRFKQNEKVAVINEFSELITGIIRNIDSYGGNTFYDVKHNDGYIKHIPESSIYSMPKQKSLSRKAMDFSIEYHEDSINELIIVANYVSCVSELEELSAVVYLQDILTKGCSLEKLEIEFSKEIVAAVVALTKKKEETDRVYLRRLKVNDWARVIKIGDFIYKQSLLQINDSAKEKYWKDVYFLENKKVI
ncbi:hypothetical protein [Liquorilactobacillus hordei]|uniref:Uncharacterized protein n=1 Tax=Liquorilactobacillus hordei DSM 19519 TaxID=1423759 RepID=A0A0R1MG62_9LACO|nr:hypothetical protein [Liquorilactobacillus hordei]KRL04916.1 hypothetical protein FC92_GL001748 [Liquorilactobacillus hordei DSM 19519]QYH51642.1 hypothetical protein G6O70_03725 [Liquorilactobacillus hordei DSM 19519]